MKSDEKERLTITPETKVGDVLDSYPDLEELLIEIAPAFKKLRNPVLRKTVARVTSLRQAARVGGVSIGDMINRLRAATGQTELEVNDSAESEAKRPQWLDERSIWKTLDARPMIESGQEPLGIVMRDLSDLPQHQVYELIAPFEPAPLIDKARQRGLETFCVHEPDGSTRTFFTLP